MKNLRLLIASIILLFFYSLSEAQTWNIPIATGGTSSAFLGTTNSTDLFFRTANIDRLRILGTGTFAGTLKLMGPHFVFGTGGATINWPSTGHLSFRTAVDPDNLLSATSRMIIMNDGRVGIGTSSPAANFEVQNASNPWMYVSSTNSAGVLLTLATCDGCSSAPALTNDGILSTSMGNSGNLLLQTKNTNKSIKFITNYGGTQGVRMTVNHDGKVGIGTTNPTANLEVQSIDNPWLYVSSNTNNSGVMLTLATCDGCSSGPALINDGILTTSMGNSGNLLLQAKNTSKSIKFITNYGGYHGVRMIVNHDGKVGIGTTNFVGDYKLYVGGKIVCEELKVKLQANWPDFVFAENHKLRSLEEVQSYIQENKHLPDVPSAEEVKENGIETGEMFKIQMQKIEELTLYLLEMKKENEELKKRLEKLENK